MQLHPSGYYAWLKEPISNRDKANGILLEQIKEAYKQSHHDYGFRNITKDLRESGIIASKKRIARLMALHKLYGAGMVKCKPKHKAGAVHKAISANIFLSFVFSSSNSLRRLISETLIPPYLLFHA